MERCKQGPYGIVGAVIYIWHVVVRLGAHILPPVLEEFTQVCIDFVRRLSRYEQDKVAYGLKSETAQTRIVKRTDVGDGVDGGTGIQAILVDELGDCFAGGA